MNIAKEAYVTDSKATLERNVFNLGYSVSLFQTGGA